jgi:hypothetical protein
MTVRDELQARALFEQRDGTAATPLRREIERRAMLAAIDAGLLRRALVVARRE